MYVFVMPVRPDLPLRLHLMQLQDVLESYKAELPTNFRMASTDEGNNIFPGRKKHHVKLDTHHITVDKVCSLALTLWYACSQFGIV
jgi:hypothetical protein